ncbi:DUF6492 family protein [Desulfobacter sp. UBA2225]|uniref:DUF6492 family protein n=1 Tax=Desulfobacter sp. UBA2225 TaxID=1961413 RepID=UPI002580AEDB|nr:DUF6492 family protein [Desulfobacter sp. UBA2225]
MDNLVLFCKSYSKDMLRAKRLAESVQRFNCDKLPLFMCVPGCDLDTFKRCFEGIDCKFLTDEQVLFESSKRNGELPRLYPPHLLQQLIKLEFWRLGLCRNYVWIDSDSYFIRPFDLTDFMVDAETPYLIQEEFSVDHAKQKWQGISKKEMEKRIKRNIALVEKFRRLFNNSGPFYNFGGGMPIVWSMKVLENFNKEYLKPRKMPIYEILFKYPCETHLYGEYLHNSQVIPVHGKIHMFKSYLYLDEFIKSQMEGENEYSIAQSYLGICIQSNWTVFKKRQKILNRFSKHLKEYQVAIGLMRFKQLSE